MTWTPFVVWWNRIANPGPRWFRWMMRRVLQGMQRAAVVFHTTSTVEARNFSPGTDRGRKAWCQAPSLGHSSALGPASSLYRRRAHPRPSRWANHTCLHVGSCIPRKRVSISAPGLPLNLRSRFPATQPRESRRCLLVGAGTRGTISRVQGLGPIVPIMYRDI